MLKRIILPIVIIVIALAVFMALKQSKAEKTPRTTPEKIWRVTTIAAEFQQLSPEIILYGRVETPNKSTLKSALIADVTSVNALEGSEVKAGQLLVTLDDTDVNLLLQQRISELAEISALILSENERFTRDKGLLSQEQVLLELTKKSVARHKKLMQTHLMAESSHDDALAAEQRQLITLKRLKFDIAEHPARAAQLSARKMRAEVFIKQAQVDVGRCQIIAPYDGRISSLNIAVGDRVRVGDSLLSLYDLNKLEVRAQLPSRHINVIRSLLATDQLLPATATIGHYNYDFSLKRLSGEVKLDSGGIDGLFALTANTTKLAIGTFVELNFKLPPQDNVLAIPHNSLYGLDHVYIIKDAHLQPVNIERIGEYSDKAGLKYLIVASDRLKQGDQIISTQLPNAIKGLRVEAVSE